MMELDTWKITRRQTSKQSSKRKVVTHNQQIEKQLLYNYNERPRGILECPRAKKNISAYYFIERKQRRKCVVSKIQEAKKN